MGRGTSKGRERSGLPANHWTYHDPDRHLWTPSELAQARQVPTRGVWEALYGGGGGERLSFSSPFVKGILSFSDIRKMQSAEDLRNFLLERVRPSPEASLQSLLRDQALQALWNHEWARLEDSSPGAVAGASWIDLDPAKEEELRQEWMRQAIFPLTENGDSGQIPARPYGQPPGVVWIYCALHNSDILAQQLNHLQDTNPGRASQFFEDEILPDIDHPHGEIIQPQLAKTIWNLACQLSGESIDLEAHSEILTQNLSKDEREKFSSSPILPISSQWSSRYYQAQGPTIYQEALAETAWQPFRSQKQRSAILVRASERVFRCQVERLYYGELPSPYAKIRDNWARRHRYLLDGKMTEPSPLENLRPLFTGREDLLGETIERIDRVLLKSESSESIFFLESSLLPDNALQRTLRGEPLAETIANSIEYEAERAL